VAILNFPSTPKKTYFVEISVENSNQVCYQKKELHLHIFQNGPILNLSCDGSHLGFYSTRGDGFIPDTCSKLPGIEGINIFVINSYWITVYTLCCWIPRWAELLDKFTFIRNCKLDITFLIIIFLPKNLF
jgi:hypothetical protein